jgi:hypothetical protein
VVCARTPVGYGLLLMVAFARLPQVGGGVSGVKGASTSLT